MFIGHFGAGLAAKPLARRVSLGTLFLASQFIDLIWPTLLLLGLETVRIAPGDTKLTPLEFVHYPISHSLLAVAGWSVLFGAVHFAVRRRASEALLCGALVTSHWLLDLLTHRPDLPLSPGGAARVGLGLWNYPALAIGIEVLVFACGLLLYLRTTTSSDKVGRFGLWALVGFLALVYAGNVLGPPPPAARAIVWAGQAQWLLVAWAYWVDRHREVS
ncbi:MAG TPA: hypothetical protein VMZ50_10425 [Phycisphaerae bacterium]|nr:hypothetical protein [Phycisphaerae bacterium]